jgi:hypothetical protein
VKCCTAVGETLNAGEVTHTYIFGRNIAVSNARPRVRATSWRCSMSEKPKGHKIGRDAGNGQFIPVKEARSRPTTTTVEIVPNPGRGDTGRKGKK